MKGYLHIGAGALLTLVLLLLATINLGSVPPLWWDEGWTLTLARTWVEQGHYGRLLAGHLAPPGLEAAFPVTAPIALSFYLFGVGVWQGRLVGVFFTLGTLALIYHLARRLYDRSVAIGTLAVLLLMSPYSSMHPVLIGRQVLGEMPSLFYLLAGYACFLPALQKPPWFMLAAVGLWGIALIAKAQVLPFWTASLLVPLSVTLLRRNWRLAGLLGMGALGSLVVFRLLPGLQQHLLYGHTIPGSPVHGLYDVTALVPVGSARLFALIATLLFGLPTLLGLCYATWQFIEDRDKAALGVDLEVVRLALLVLAGSWFAWYLLLSVGWVRYLFPATLIGSIFVAAMLRDLTDRFSLPSTIERSGSALRHLRFDRHSVGALLAIVLIALIVPATSCMLYQAYVVEADASALQVADFLNTQTAPEALVETYDSELFFLLNRRYHYPPDQIHVELDRRTFLDQDVPIDYDPLAADPDYLVVGPHSKLWRLYNPVLATGAFRLLHSYSRYKVYERVR